MKKLVLLIAALVALAIPAAAQAQHFDGPGPGNCPDLYSQLILEPGDSFGAMDWDAQLSCSYIPNVVSEQLTITLQAQLVAGTGSWVDLETHSADRNSPDGNGFDLFLSAGVTTDYVYHPGTFTGCCTRYRVHVVATYHKTNGNIPSLTVNVPYLDSGYPPHA